MSSQSKRRAESEEVAHKKKPRKGGAEKDINQDDEEDELDIEDDDFGALDKDNIVMDERTRAGGERDDHKKVGLGYDNGFGAGDEASKEKNGAPAGSRTRSPQRNITEDIGGEDEEADDEEEREYAGEYEDDDGTASDDYEEDEED